MSTFYRIASCVLIVVLIGISCEQATADTLDFDVPVPGTINDANGLGTGFTTRLPGTGSSLPPNDPNMVLNTSPGRLLLTSTDADIPFSRALNVMEAPGFLLSGIGAADITIRAKIDGINLVHASDQIMLYAAVSATQILRSGFHQGNSANMISNTGGFDSFPFSSGDNAIVSFDDVILTLGRTSGLWSMSWQDLSHPAMSGSSTGQAIPFLDGKDDLYVGIMAANANSRTSFTTAIDWIDVSTTPVPEPSTAILCMVGAGMLFCIRPKKRKSTTKKAG